jgi:hypothetical protein
MRGSSAFLGFEEILVILNKHYFKVELKNIVPRLLVTANVVASWPILVILMIEAIHSSETPVLTRAIRRHIPEDGILHSHHRENPKSYKLELFHH